MTKKQDDKLPSWNLTDLYKATTAPEINADLEQIKALCLDFAKKYRGNITDLDASQLLTAIKEYEHISDLTAKIGSFAFLTYAQDQSNKENSSFYQNISEKLTDISQPTIFFSLELNKIEEAKLHEMLKANEGLAFYKSWLLDLRVEKPYQLSEEAETILHQKYITSRQSWVKLYDETQADTRFTFDDKQLTIQEVFQYLSDADRRLREKAAKSVEAEFAQRVKLFAHITNVIAKDKQVNDDMRGFAKPISSRNLGNLVEDEVVANLIKVVKDNYKNTSHRYYQLKSKILGISPMKYWDRNAPLATIEETYIPWDEAVKIVLDAYNEFSPEIGKIGKEFFDKNWVDAAMRPGKYSGAFACHATAKVHPYLLINYQGKARDVMTLAHELGHGIHMYLSAGQGELMCGTSLNLAETASIFGEQLVFEALLKRESDPKVRATILAHKIDDTLSTIVRQIAFTEFELKIHDERKKGEIPADKINEIWMESQKASLGPVFDIDENYKYSWQYISHFIHLPFYVYSYAFANCLVNALYNLYKNGMPGFVEKYTSTLAAGGTKRYAELLAGFDLDASGTKFWQNGMDVVIAMIDKLEELVDNKNS